LALGIGANTAVFSVFNAVLLRPFPYPDPDALVALSETQANAGGRFTISPPDFLMWRASATTLQNSAAYRSWTPNLTEVEQAERLEGLRVSGDFFALLGVKPLVGSSLVREDETRANRVVVISHGLWHRVFGADPTIAGRSIRLDGEGYVVAGVMTRSLQFPYRDVEIWAPLNLDREQQDRGEHSLLVLARLKPAASLEQARAERRTLTAQHETETNGHVPAITRLRDWFVGPSNRTTLWALMGAVGLLLLAACANVANLLLARGRVRGREFMIRTAIGATRGQLIAQLVTESVALSVIAGALGLFLALWSVEALMGVLPEGSPYRMAPITIDWRVLGYTLGLSLAAALLFGILPALKHSRTHFNAALASARSSAFRTQGALPVVQTAMAVTLLIGAGLLTRGFLSLWQIDPGFTAEAS
jgi:predicted permease